MKKRIELAIMAALTIGFVQSALAQQSAAPGLQKSLSGLFSSTKEEELVEPDQAFKLKVKAAVKGSNSILAELAPAQGYYLYKEKIRFSIKDGSGVVISAIKLPAGEMKIDHIFGKTEVYRKPIPVEITLKRAPKADKVTLMASYQGCHERLGVCYPPIEKTLNLALP